jgi:glycosyltransferase involved in cell wall biosynthesis
VIDVVLPVLDEALAIPRVLARLPAHCRAIVVDNGSTDGSAAVAFAHGALVVTETRRGFGAACYAGLCAAGADVIAFMDCDGSLDPQQLPLVIDPVLAGHADLVLGARRLSTPDAMPRHARWANRYLAHRVRRGTGAALSDLGPMRAAGRVELLNLHLTDRRSGWPLEMVLRAGHAGWRIAQVDVDYEPRVGRSKVTGTVRGTVTAVNDMRRQLRAFSQRNGRT